MFGISFGGTRIKELEETLSEQEKKLAETERLLLEQSRKLSEYEQLLLERNRKLTEYEELLSERDQKHGEQEKLLIERAETISDYQRLLSERDQRITELLQRQDGAEAVRKELASYFRQAASFRGTMDRSLTRVVDHVHKAGELSNAGEKELTELMEAMRERSAALSDAGETLEHCMEEGRALEQMLTSLGKGIEELGAFFRSVSVLCLTAAINAGRLKAEGEPFVRTAEDIRIEAEKRERELKELERIVREAEGQYWKAMSFPALSEETGYSGISERLSALKENETVIFEKQKAILNEMEALGETFMEAQRLDRRAEERLLSASGKGEEQTSLSFRRDHNA